MNIFFWIRSTLQHVRPVVTHWPGKGHDVVAINGDPRILISDGLTPFSVECRVSSVMYQCIPENFVLLSSVRPRGVPYGE